MSSLHYDFPSTYQALVQQLLLDKGLPYVENWSAAADYLQLLVNTIDHRKPEKILECGSGLTTLVLARSCQLHGCGKVTSLENGADYADKTRQVLKAYGLDGFVEVIHAPLVEYPLGDEIYQWYDISGLSESSFELFSIDGPPGFLQKHSRYPALPLLRGQLAQGCEIFLDDAAREDEKTLVRRWQRLYPELSCEYLEYERGCTHCRLTSL